MDVFNPKMVNPILLFPSFAHCSIVLDTCSNPGNFENGDVRNHEKTPFQASHMYQTGTSVTSVSGINLYPAILRRQEWTHPEAISQILGRTPRPNCFSLMRRVIFLGRKPWWLVVSFFGEDILPQSTGNWYKPNNPPILKGFRKQKTRKKKKPQRISPTNASVGTLRVL